MRYILRQAVKKHELKSPNANTFS